MNNSPVSQIVLRRVRTIHAVRALSAPILSACIFFLALVGIGREVWVAKVLENMPALANVPGTLTFFADAFLETDIMVQSLSIIAVGALVWLAHAVALNLRKSTAHLGHA